MPRSTEDILSSMLNGYSNSKKLKDLLGVLDGLDGMPGEKGDKGDPGEKGDKGDKGDCGECLPIGGSSLEVLTGARTWVSIRDLVMPVIMEHEASEDAMEAEDPEEQKDTLTEERVRSLITEVVKAQSPISPPVQTQKPQQTDYTVFNPYVTTAGLPVGGKRGYVLTCGGGKSISKWVKPTDVITGLTPNAIVIGSSTGGLQSMPIPANGSILYSNGFFWATLPIALNGNVLRSNPSLGPEWGKVNLSSDVSGTLQITNGGTGSNSFPANRIPFSTGSFLNSSNNLQFDSSINAIDFAAVQRLRGLLLLRNTPSSDNTDMCIGTTGASIRAQILNTTGSFIFTAGVNTGSNFEIARFTGSGRLGIGTNSPVNPLTVSGSVSIGSSFSGSPAPTDGLIVQGLVGVGTTTPAYPMSIQGGSGSGESILQSISFKRTFTTSVTGGLLAFLASNGITGTHDFGALYFGSPSFTADGGAAQFQLRLGGSATATSNNGVMVDATINGSNGAKTYTLVGNGGLINLHTIGNQRVCLFGNTPNAGTQFFNIFSTAGGGPTANPPAGSVAIYVDNATGQLRARGSAGTITTLALP